MIDSIFDNLTFSDKKTRLEELCVGQIFRYYKSIYVVMHDIWYMDREFNCFSLSDSQVASLDEGINVSVSIRESDNE